MKTLQERIDEFAAEQIKGEQLLKDIRAAFQPEFEAIEAKLMPTYSVPNYDVLISEEYHKPYIRLGEPRVEPEETATDYGIRCIDQEEIKELNDRLKPDFDRIKIKYGFKVEPFSYNFEHIQPLEENVCRGYSDGGCDYPDLGTEQIDAGFVNPDLDTE